MYNFFELGCFHPTPPIIRDTVKLANNKIPYVRCMSTELKRPVIEKIVKLTTCHIGQTKCLFDNLASNGLELHGHHIIVTHLGKQDHADKYSMSCSIVGENEIEINKKAREIGDFMLNYCIVKGVVCSNICLINETKDFVEGRKWADCVHFFVDEEDELTENGLKEIISKLTLLN